MILDLKLLFAGGEPIKIDYTFTPESDIIDGCSPVKVTGILKSISSVIYMAVSYTHLDVYKRQILYYPKSNNI